MKDATLQTSVILCAYTEQRWDIFVQAVESLICQNPPADEIIIVIDHNPTLLAKAQVRFPQQIVIENSQDPGLSGARNSGLAVSRGRYIAFLDDDAIACPTWLAVLVEQCQRPNVLGVGSRIDPAWIEPPPRWFPEEFYWVVGCSYRGLPTITAPIRNPIGCSMCIRRDVFTAVGEFHIGLGRVGTIPLGCEETELCIRARQHYQESSFVYEPSIAVRHQVTPNRTTSSYFFRRCYAEGISKSVISRLGPASDKLGPERNYILRTLPLGILRGLRQAFFRLDPAGAVSAVVIVAGVITTASGYLIGRYVAKTPQMDHSVHLFKPVEN